MKCGFRYKKVIIPVVSLISPRYLAGKNSHHIVEATFKAFARALVLKSLESCPVHIRPDGPTEEGDEEITIFVGKGDSISMDGEMQKHYQHCLPKKPKGHGCRNVLVFRHGMEKLSTRTLVKL